LRAEAVAALATRGLVVADLGCGAGFLTGYLAERVRRVIAVDHSEAMLAEARKAIPADLPVEYRRGALESLPLEDGEVDAVVANLVMRHVADIPAAAREIGRVLRPHGSVVITDLRPHREEWMRDEFGDLRLGLEPTEVAAAFEAGSFPVVEEIPVEDCYRMKSGSGRTARLELFMIRAVRAA
jgi:ArsR family transcriptional regulator